MRLVQVSDCHLAASPEASYRGLNADEGLARLAPAISAFGPDWLVLTGDLSEDASDASYRRMVDWACRFDAEVAWLPGNHDDRSVMAPWFASAGFEAGPIVDLGCWQLVLLDSARVNDPAGTLDADRLQPLRRIEPGRPTGVFVHHPPVPVGAAWIDKVMLRQPHRLFEAVGAVEEIRFLSFGHVHQRFRSRQHDLELMAGPSSVANSQPGTRRFAAGEISPLGRWFVLEGETWRTGYLSC